MKTTESQRRANKQYACTRKGKTARKRAQDKYNHSARGRLSRSSYLRGPKGKEAIARYKKNKALMKGSSA